VEAGLGSGVLIVREGAGSRRTYGPAEWLATRVAGFRPDLRIWSAAPQTT
jgi:hypothetical protein